MSSPSSSSDSELVVLQVPQELRVPLAKKLRRAYLSDYEWHLRANPKPDYRVEGERALTDFLVSETRKVCEELGVTGDTVGILTNGITSAPTLARWFYRVDFASSLGEEDVDFERYCPEKGDVLPIVYGAAPEGSQFQASLNAQLHTWIEQYVRDEMRRPTALKFNVDWDDSVHAWVENTDEEGTSIVNQGDAKPANYFCDELLSYTKTHGLVYAYTPNKRRSHWRCKLVVWGMDMEGERVSVFGGSTSLDGSMEDAARIMLNKLRAVVGLDDPAERPPSPVSTYNDPRRPHEKFNRQTKRQKQ
ncbi:hypothetical protein TWF506_004722 [Arthrobotrys conoides]|uniref:Uncharacterized protein n=1 Tax=Arthrobotrys conoides TaxID=74498 RepID=A0AAN8MWG4_9PEZI